MNSGYNVAIVGATGMVGQEFIKVLLQRKFPAKNILLYASDRSAGRKLFVGHQEIVVKETASDSFDNVDIALFSAGSDIAGPNDLLIYAAFQWTFGPKLGQEVSFFTQSLIHPADKKVFI